MGIIKERKKLVKHIKKAKNIFIMAHKNLDLDALGSSIGMYILLKKKKKDCYLIIDDKKHEMGVEKVLRELEGCINIIKSSDLEKHLNRNKRKNLLMVLDTNKTDLVQNKNVLDKIDKKIVIDHHELGKTSITDALMIVDPDVSSTCEMITELIEYYDIEIESYYATVLLAGIVLDTNNFMLKTHPETYYSAYFLSCLGASAKKVQYLLKQDIKEYTESQKLVSSIKTMNDRIAITKGTPNTIYRKEDLARVADTLLFFNNIESSFVIGKIDKHRVGVSARSLGTYEINKLLEKIGGGGTANNGAATFENMPISKVEQIVRKAIEDMED